ncbi:uncharacterized protein PHALS_04902 [Plasmopara halstedii]|uniref:Uncharacterized protein n=1 Tax=Plasmopara halstedii TaxID=4781 RepID=A0A0P1AAW2_PLAHL|nr:uncharacterized protein PHALS_04902 [Plasmopara halstedii]CEG37300.1 hypothetical protein PHALS_04902 [Plasmopara halstedii]|eukprot:XP_024573669.1 hypothetical protein PHALS_04902 [Plasmopara halstedii]
MEASPVVGHFTVHRFENGNCEHSSRGGGCEHSSVKEFPIDKERQDIESLDEKRWHSKGLRPFCGLSSHELKQEVNKDCFGVDYTRHIRTEDSQKRVYWVHPTRGEIPKYRGEV